MVVLLGGWLVVFQRAISLPEWVLERVETQVNSALDGRLIAEVGGVDLVVDDGIKPRIRLNGVQLNASSGRPILVLPELRATFWALPLIQGKIALRSVRVRGAAASLRRLSNGTLDLDLGGAGLRPESVSQALEQIEAVFAVPALRDLETIRAEGFDIRLDDDRLDRVWRVSDGQVDLTQTDTDISLSAALNIGDQVGAPSQVRFNMSTAKAGLQAKFSAAVIGVPARDLAVQSAALTALSVLDASISGALKSELDVQGKLGALDARLDISDGALNPSEGAKPLAFDGANLHLSYDPSGQKVLIHNLSLRSRAARLQADGQTLLRDFKGGLPQELLAQIAISDLQLDPEGVFEEPAHFSDGALDLRIRLDPFRVDLGQAQLIQDERRISTRGTVSADADGWRASFDSTINRITQAQLLNLWPTALVAKTRNWVVDNIPAGSLHDVRAAVRIAPGQDPRLALSYEFRDAVARVVKTLPPIQEGRGFAVLGGTGYVMLAEEGHIVAPDGGRIEVANSTLDVPDIRIKPAPANVHLVTRSTIPSMLSLLDEPPFRFLTKAGLATDIAQGWAEAETDLAMILKKGVTPDEINYAVRARLTGVASEKLVPGKEITADTLRLSVDKAGMTIGGRGEFSGLPFDAHWHQAFGSEHAGQSQVRGFAQVTPQSLAALGVKLPDGLLRGTGWASLSLDLVKGQATHFRAVTDLIGLGLSIPEIGWSLGTANKGRLEVAGRLSNPPVIDTLNLQAAGLTAQGAVSIKPNNAGLERARFDRLTLGAWFNGAANIVGRGEGRTPKIEIRSGVLDLRKRDLGSGTGGGSGAGKGGAASTPISVNLDRLIVADGFALTGLRGEFNTKGGMNGTFRGALNGGAPVQGAIGPSDNGRVAARVTSGDAGAVLSSAGIFTGAQSGSFALNLVPVGAQSYEGSAAIRGLKVIDAPTLAEMLSAASIVGLLEQLNGDGIVFQEVNAGFRLTPSGLSVTHAEATGASMGVTISGNYSPTTGALDMEGVFSPLYIVNGIGQFLARRGEGLFGFTYQVTGTKSAPKVSINPLSILTPGMFREIFRRDPKLLKAE
ncbi:hypothetical protein BFP70_08215 [Thioclava sp. SK-1]|nr:hypothetical protein BFP70_08215 [Thioclava sp. SK-1]